MHLRTGAAEPVVFSVAQIWPAVPVSQIENHFHLSSTLSITRHNTMRPSNVPPKPEGLSEHPVQRPDSTLERNQRDESLLNKMNGF